MAAPTSQRSACPVCEEPGREALFRKDGWPVVRCRRCRLVYVDADVRRDAVEEIYDESYYQGEVFGDYLGEREVRVASARGRVGMLASIVPGGRLLDVGCAAGFFLHAASEHYAVAGVEVSPFASRYARETFGLDVTTGEIFDARLGDGEFDVVTLWDVVEHLADPRAVLAEAARVTRPGGMLVLTTGDVRGPLARRDLEHWNLMTPPAHLAFFSRRTLERLLNACGFELERLTSDGIVAPRALPAAPRVLASTLGIGNVMTAIARRTDAPRPHPLRARLPLRARAAFREGGRERALVLAGPGEGDELAAALAGRGREVALVTVRPGARGLVRAVLEGRRRLRADGAGVVVTLSPPGSAHLAGRALGRRRPRWLAHVAAPLGLRQDRWGRVFDPRARALRRADTVTTEPRLLEDLLGSAGASPTAAAGAHALADAALSRPEPVAHGGLRILMLGTLNTPHVEHLARAMRERGHEVVVGGDVVASYAPSTLPGDGIDVRPLELPALPWVRRLYRELRPDVVHAHWLPAYGFLAAVMRLRPLVVMAWGSDVYRASPRELRQSRFAIRRAAVAMADSDDLVARLVELGAEPERTHLLNWGVDLERFAPAADRAEVRRALGLGEPRVVLSPRALTPLYNPATIVEAFERAAVPETQLVLKHIGTGEPDIGRELPAAARIVGHVPYEQIADYYRAADVCVSIPGSDSSPRSVWEAMACGCPCVLSDLPWVHELIEDGRHALIVPPDAEAVAAAVRRLLTEPELAASIAREARALVAARRDERVEMDRLSDLYRSVAG